ncbi:relaxase [Bradyrhizobium yuanmingense]|uniref:relaxase/mobilization nuclease domain-containing protein n=1 Tax=Bradyrhizobium yuanmingense TaxID=108015 RepID=UPI0012FC0387|nr:relaxase [Bradyrhizobium yuanmingense]MVT55806.1 relaxase [Bradyrhizobium yuanmingense]
MEQTLGLTDQPRAIVIHEKDGRRHAHVVWSRIDADMMRAINLPFYKTKLMELSKELFLENGWELPNGYRVDKGKNPLNFTLAEWQQAKRLGIDPREVKQTLQGAWQASDNLQAFQHALEERGYFLARGDRRGFVVIDLENKVYFLSRYAGVKNKDLKSKLSEPERLPDVGQTQRLVYQRVSRQLRAYIAQKKAELKKEMEPLRTQAMDISRRQRVDRKVTELKLRERERNEVKERAGRFRRGLGMIFDVLTGRLFKLRRQNEQEAAKAYLRDKAHREQSSNTQLRERQKIQLKIDALKSQHRDARVALARQVGQTLQDLRRNEHEREHGREREGPELEM